MLTYRQHQRALDEDSSSGLTPEEFQEAYLLVQKMLTQKKKGKGKMPLPQQEDEYSLFTVCHCLPHIQHTRGSN